jgi:hypothetical protein
MAEVTAREGQAWTHLLTRWLLLLLLLLPTLLLEG